MGRTETSHRLPCLPTPSHILSGCARFLQRWRISCTTREIPDGQVVVRRASGLDDHRSLATRDAAGIPEGVQGQTFLLRFDVRFEDLMAQFFKQHTAVSPLGAIVQNPLSCTYTITLCVGCGSVNDDLSFPGRSAHEGTPKGTHLRPCPNRVP